MRTAPISIEGLVKSFGQLRALDDVSLEVGAGEFLTLLGPSGSGKSTLLMAVAGFVRPDAGRIRIAGEDMVRLPANKRNIGVVFQSYALFPHMDVMSNVAFPLKVRNISRAETAERAQKALKAVRLDGLESRRISQLSGGQRQRVALARAMVFEPRVLLMDEPLSALDKSLREEMQIEIRELHRRLGLTTLYVTHDQREALTLSDRIAVMDRGAIVHLGSPNEIYSRPRTRFVAEFVGEAVIIPAPRLREHLPGAAVPAGDVAVRAEDIRLRPSGRDKGDVRIVATVRAVVFQGDSWLVQAETATGDKVSVRVQRPDEDLVHGLEIGAPAVFHLALDKMHHIA